MFWDGNKNSNLGDFKIALVDNARKYFYNDYEKGGQVALSESSISTWLMKHTLIDICWLQSYTTKSLHHYTQSLGV